MKLNKNFLAIVLVLTLIASTTKAQSPWLNNNKPDFISLEFLKPSLKGGSLGISGLSGTYDISGGIAIGDKNEIIFDLPISHFKQDRFFEDATETTIGNLYVAIRTGDRSRPIRWEFGLLLPTTDDEKYLAQFMGINAMANMSEKFSSRTWALSAKLISEKVIDDSNGTYYRVRAGLMYANDREYDVSGVFFDATSQLGIRTSSGFSLFGGLNTRINIYDNVESDGDDDRTSFFFALGVSHRIHAIEPGFTISLPLDEPYKHFVNNIFGVSLLLHLDN